MPMKDDIGREFQDGTKNRRGALGGRSLDWSSRPEAYKTYPEAQNHPLPRPMPDSMPFVEGRPGPQEREELRL